jgi:hypothetical protein
MKHVLRGDSDSAQVTCVGHQMRMTNAPPSLPREMWFRPLIPEDRDQGDPFVLHVPPGVAPFRYYAYTTWDGAVAEGRAFPVYGTHDLLRWEPLGETLIAVDSSAHWAPCVCYLPHLEKPFVMLYSRGKGTGIEAHIGHRIYRAESHSPVGPFISREAPVTPEEIDFAIDPDVFIDHRGTYRLTFAMDFIEGVRIGTGLAEAEISPDLSTVLSPPKMIARASSDWQIFDPSRSMPWKTIPGVSWEEGHTVAWHCIEAPCTFYSPNNERITLYSGGCYENFYGVGVLSGDGLEELSPTPAEALIRPGAEHGVFAPGHCSCVIGPDQCRYVVFHARYGSLSSVRQLSIAPLLWRDDGSCYCPDPADSGI